MPLATLRRALPGLAVLAVVGVAARLVGAATPLSPLVLAIAGGVLLGTVVGVPAWGQSGLDRYPLLLETGIVLLGAGMTVDQLVSTGPVVVGLAASVIVVGVLFVELVGRGAGVGHELRALLAAGASVCGVSAVLAVAGSIDGDEAAVTYAAGTILLFDAVTLLVFPIAGAALGLPDRAYGVWAGLSLFSTGPSAAAGFAVSETAGRWATVTKLVRNAFIGVLAVAYAVRYATDGRADPTEIWYRFPKFLLGFLVVAAIANLGVFDAAALAVIDAASDWLFTLAFVGLGVELNPRQLRASGIRPIAVVLAHFVTVSALALLAVTYLL